MDSNEIIEHFNSLGIELEQYGTSASLCEDMWEALQEDGLAMSDDENTYYQCESAAEEMWEKHAHSFGLRPEDLEEERKADFELAKRTPREVIEAGGVPAGQVATIVAKAPSATLGEALSKKLAEQAYESERTRELERQLAESRADDRMVGKLLPRLEGLTDAELVRLRFLITQRQNGDV